MENTTIGNRGDNPPKKKGRRGFACMDPERQREIARKGGRAAHQQGTAHEFTPEKAREAGKKGGEKIVELRGASWMAEIGSKGAIARTTKQRAKKLVANAEVSEVPCDNNCDNNCEKE